MFASAVLRLQAYELTERLIPTAGNQKWLRPLSEPAGTLWPPPLGPPDEPRFDDFALGRASAARTAIVLVRTAAGVVRTAPRRTGSVASTRPGAVTAIAWVMPREDASITRGAATTRA